MGWQPERLSLPAKMIVFIPVLSIMGYIFRYTQFIYWSQSNLSHFFLSLVIIAVIVIPFTLAGVFFDEKRKKRRKTNDQ
ncbi:hypothetical protein [Bacillus halotolerans]|uniref:hypothetical protein n=1 Tax=Bacillus halotolerans TaxID=260554 RepID=UPI00404A437C